MIAIAVLGLAGWYLGLIGAVTLWSLALAYFGQTVLSYASVLSRNGMLDSIRFRVVIQRSFWTACLVVAGVWVFDLASLAKLAGELA